MWTPIVGMECVRRRALLCATVLLLAGCGSDSGSVHGTVTYKDGAPLVGARVILRGTGQGTSNRTASGVTDGKGYYELGTVNKGDGILPGNYQVSVVEDRGALDSLRPLSIDGRYTRGSTSGLTLVVNPGEKMVFDLALDRAK